MRPRDTTLQAQAAQDAAFAAMSMDQRVRLALEMSDQMRSIAAAGIRVRHPDYDDDAIRYALYRLLYGDALFRAAWPEAPELDP